MPEMRGATGAGNGRLRLGARCRIERPRAPWRSLHRDPIFDPISPPARERAESFSGKLPLVAQAVLPAAVALSERGQTTRPPLAGECLPHRPWAQPIPVHETIRVPDIRGFKSLAR